MMPASCPKLLPPRQLQRHSGFTLVELMVVIVIIGILAGIIVVGISATLSGVIDRSTETRLEMLNSMMAAHANADMASGAPGAGARRLPAELAAVPGGPTYSTLHDGNGQPIIPPTTSEPEQLLEDEAVARTQAVLRRLLSVPENASTYASLPDDAFTGPLPDDNSLLNYVDGNQSPRHLQPRLLLDGHGQVILYVPPSGLTGLAFQDGSRNVTIRAADGRAFWASAGADGLFIDPGADGIVGNADDRPAADDNVYSTTVVMVPAQ